MKRSIFNTTIAALVAVAAFSLASAQGGRQEGRPTGGPGFGGRGPMSLARFVDLTDAQRQQVRAILEEERQSRQGPPAAMVLHRQLETEILADAPDDQKIETVRQQVIQAQAEALAHAITVQRKIAQILTPEQRAKARERLAQTPRGRGDRGEGRRSHPLPF